MSFFNLVFLTSYCLLADQIFANVACTTAGLGYTKQIASIPLQQN
jgi:hypothetical protein